MKIFDSKITNSKFSVTKFLDLQFWQYLALLSGSIIAVVMALASISYNSTLGTSNPAFGWVPVTNKTLFEVLALAFDLGMIASVFGFWHWQGRNRVAAAICVMLFLIASVFSVHSVRGYIALNVTKSLAPLKRNKDIYASLKLDLAQAQNHMASLQAALIKARGRTRTRLLREVEKQPGKIQLSRNNLARTEIDAQVAPVPGLDWFLSIILWIFNSTCWTAWFGTRSRTLIDTGDGLDPRECDSVSDWLQAYGGNNPEHCTRLYADYQNWCKQHSCTPLVQYGFYARLIELGAEKFRKNGNGTTCYRLPQSVATRRGADDRMGA